MIHLDGGLSLGRPCLFGDFWHLDRLVIGFTIIFGGALSHC
jgi:hypothetical protein